MSHAGVKNVIWTECSINCGLELVSNLIWLGLMELGTNLCLCEDFTIKEKNLTRAFTFKNLLRHYANSNRH